MKYRICDRCGASVPEGAGALCLVYGGGEHRHLCDTCLGKVFPGGDRTVEGLKAGLHGSDRELLCVFADRVQAYEEAIFDLCSFERETGWNADFARDCMSDCATKDNRELLSRHDELERNYDEKYRLVRECIDLVKGEKGGAPCYLAEPVEM